MREAIGGTWLFNLVIFFVLLFAGYMCLSINYSKAFSVKDKIITEIERNGGIKNISSKDDETIKNITNYLVEVGYRNQGSCKDYKYGCDRNGQCTDLTNSSTGEYAFCLSVVEANKTFRDVVDETAEHPGEFIFFNYYKVKVFYQLDLPVIRQMFNFSVNGDTRTLYNINNA